MSRKEDVLRIVKLSPGLTDREIAERLSGPSTPQQPFHAACRELERGGLILRARNRSSDKFIGNYPISSAFTSPNPNMTSPLPVIDVGTEQLPEDAIKEVLKDWLTVEGWLVQIAWGKKQGVDIDAVRDGQRWVIEVKGPGSRQPMRVNYFLAILGETLQRMSDAHTMYSIALPDMLQYRNLWKRLPSLAKSRTKISILFVNVDGKIDHLME